jgi:monofunctional biosynthetic peptidoglycan transglycosylase
MAGTKKKKDSAAGTKGAGLRRRAVKAVKVAVALVVALPLLFVGAYAVVPPPVTPLMVLGVVHGRGLDKRWVPLDRIAPALRYAVIAGEDNRFCRHWGFDFAAMEDAIDEYVGGARLRGASTISMQTAKNLFLLPVRSFLRKGVEAYFTLYLEALLSKRRIMELYLNIVEWGPGLYGAEAAARHYFHKPASALTRREATLLAAVLPAPRRWSPAAPNAFVSRHARVLARRIGQLGPLLDCVRG